MPIDYYGAHSIVFMHSQTFASDDIVPPGSEMNYYHSWLDFHMVPSVRPHIETPEPEIIMYSDTVSSKVFDLTNARLGFQKFSSLKGQWEFIIDHDRWADWVAAKTTIEDYFNGRRIMCVLMDDPTVAYFGRAFISNWDDGEDYSRVTIDYDLNYEPKTISVDFLKPVSITASLKSDAPTFYQGDMWKKVKPYISVIATYANGRQSEVITEFGGDSDNNRLDYIGDNIVTVSHKGFTANVTVNAVKGTISRIEAEYRIYHDFALGDWEDDIRNYINIILYYKNGYYESILGTNADYICGRFETIGYFNNIPVTYNGKTTSIYARVIEGGISSITGTYKSGSSSNFDLGSYKDEIRNRININITYTNGYTRTRDGTTADQIYGRFESLGLISQAITYKGETAYINATINEGAISGFVSNWRTSTSNQFYYGDPRDNVRNNTTIFITYTNGYRRTIDGTNARQLTGYFTNIGTETVTLVYKNKSSANTLTANITEGEVYSISPKWKDSASNMFILGNPIDSIRERIDIDVRYTNNYTRTINGTNAESIYGQFEIVGIQDIQITYKGASKTISAEVIRGTIDHIEASFGEEGPRVYKVGEPIEDVLDDIDVTVYYTNGYVEHVYDVDISPDGTFENIGTETLTITYNGFSTTIDVTVVEKSITSITAVWKDYTPYTFDLGDTKDSIREHINIDVEYEDGVVETVDGSNASPISGIFDHIGSENVTISYSGFTTTINATVIEGSISYIECSYKIDPPHEFIIGDAKDLLRQYININLTYSNGYERTIDGNNAEAISGVFEDEGDELVLVSYQGNIASILATVIHGTIQSIVANWNSVTPPVFVIGDYIDDVKDYIDMTVTYTNGSIHTIDGTMADYIDGTFETDGDHTITITYDGESTTIVATVVIPLIYRFSVDDDGNTTITTSNRKSDSGSVIITNMETYNVSVPNGDNEFVTYGFRVLDNGYVLVEGTIEDAETRTLINGDSFELIIVTSTE